MILQYFIKNENKDKKLANDIYLELVNLIKKIFSKEDLHLKKNLNSSFELISFFIFAIFYSYKNQKNSKNLNQEIMNLYILDLDKSFREYGIGDTQIGKYVKFYVKKIYYRIKTLENIFEKNSQVDFQYFLKMIDISDKNENNKKLSIFLFNVIKKLLKRAKNKDLSKDILKKLIK